MSSRGGEAGAPPPAKWRVVKEPAFRRRYKSLSPEMRSKVDSAVDELASSDNPEKRGAYKGNLRVFSYEIGRSYRIIYFTDRSEREIVLSRVCDHKSVYGRG